MTVPRNLFILIGVIAGLTWSAAGAAPPAPPSPPVLIRLRQATFDPLQSQPSLPPGLSLSPGDSRSAVPYIVQFRGALQPEWKDAVMAAGGQLDSYLPDDAFLVRLDGASRDRLQALDSVRWVGPFQPAYKLAPDLAANATGLYRVQLAAWSDPALVRQRLAALGMPAAGGGRSLVVAAAAGQLTQLAQLPDVLWIEGFRRFRRSNDVATGILQAPAAWSSGYTGAGQLITIADTGLDTGVDNPAVNGDIHLDFDNRVAHISSWPVVAEPGCIANAGADDGAADVDSGHGTHVTGSAAGNGARSGGQYRGMAYQATITFQAVEQLTHWTGGCAYPDPQSYALTGLPTDLNDLFAESYAWGARIHSDSWGADVAGAYDGSAFQVDQFIWNHSDFTILFAAGNGGVDADGDGYVDENSMDSPGTAKNVIAMGASENEGSSGGYNPGGPCDTYGSCWPSDYPANPTFSDRLSDHRGELAAFSSRGPAADGRIKPDLVAPGTNVLSTHSSQTAQTGWGPGPSTYYVYMGGTSMATPQGAGAATLVRDFLARSAGLADPSSALIKAILINSAVDIPGYGNPNYEAGQPIPNPHEGWGRIDLAGATAGAGRAFVDGHSILSTNLADTFYFTATAPISPLKVSLAWADYPGNPAASRQLVNDLDLLVTAPDGSTLYYGNHFSAGWSAPGGSRDVLNNVENVYVQAPAGGVWAIQVRGANIPLGPQPYALVVAGRGTLSEPVNSAVGPVVYLIYLPIMSSNAPFGPTPPPAPAVLVNGDFEAGPTGWTEYSRLGWPLILPADSLPVTPHGGSWAVWLGGADDEIAYVEQSVAVPAGSPYLTYSHWIASEDWCGYDFAGVVIDRSTVVETYDLCVDEDTWGWVRHSVNLSAFAGRTVAVQIRAVTDSSYNSNLFIDDVSFQPSAASAGRPQPPGTSDEVAGATKQGVGIRER